MARRITLGLAAAGLVLALALWILLRGQSAESIKPEAANLAGAAAAPTPTPAPSVSDGNGPSTLPPSPKPPHGTVARARSDQPQHLRPAPPARSPEWQLLDWSVKPVPQKPGVQLREASFSAPGKYPFVRVEQEIQVAPDGKISVLTNREMVGDQVIVKLPDGSTQKNANALAERIGAKAASRPFAPDTWIFKLDRKLEAVPEGLEKVRASQEPFDYAEPDLLLRPARLPNDPRVTDFTTWHLHNNTQIDKDIRAAKAWDRRTSAAYGTTNKVIVAVLDSGVRYTHQDLAANMWRNPGEIEGNGIDDDGNGWVDDIHGIDAAGTEDWNDRDNDARKDSNVFENGYTDSNGNGAWDADADPMDPDGHGTHCAGIIGAVGNNGVGLAGVAWSGVEIMALRFIDGTGSLSDEVLCMDYARLRGAKVINASFGQDGGPSQTEINAINRLNASGVILVAAAGNGGSDDIGDDNNGAKPFYPASYTSGNIIAVGATDRNDNRAGFSNFGSTAVDLFTPGSSIYSTRAETDSSYGSGSGSSFAAPVVAGAVALLIAEYPNDTVSQRVARIINTNAVDVIPALSGLCVTGGRLNLAKLLPAADPNTLPQALVWHRPDHLEGLIPSRMRIPSEITLSNDVTVYTGLKKFNNTNGVNTSGLVNQAGGWLFYRTSPSAPWSSNSLTWHTNNGDYQFWKGAIPNVGAGTYEYFLQLDFDSGARTTYSFFTNNADGFSTGTDLNAAQSSPYTFDVPKNPATVTISDTNQIYDGTPRAVTASTVPAGLSVTVTYGGSANAPTAPGTYAVEAAVADPNYQGGATGTLTIALSSFDAWRSEKFGSNWESDPNSVSSADADHDGVSNHAEYYLDTDPLDSGSRLAIFAAPLSSNTAMITVAPAVRSGDYTLKSWSDLTRLPDVTVLKIPEDASSASFTVPSAADKNFYQLIYTPPPLP